MEPKKTYPFFETASIYGALCAVVASTVLYGVLIITSGSLTGLLVGCFGCFGIMLVPGFISTKMHISATGHGLELGRGALIGFTSGVVFGVMFSFIGVILEQFSLNMNQLFFEALEEFVLQHGDPDAADDISELREAGESGFSVGGFILNTLVYGILNLITGMIGSSIFKGEHDE